MMERRAVSTSGSSVEECVHTEGPHIHSQGLGHVHRLVWKGKLLQRTHTHPGRMKSEGGK